MHKNTPRYLQPRRSDNGNDTAIRDWDEKLRYIVTTTQYDDVVCIAGV
ncbi:hypothetical protein KA037_01390 [Patescibacteria group bacterium]|nr:hypothetical protein [Patescibacteria group bacterium]MBP7841317.1 hypothetical protein [Patescibacteria group bacterium]